MARRRQEDSNDLDFGLDEDITIPDFGELEALSFADLDDLVFDIDLIAIMDFDIDEIMSFDIDLNFDWDIDDLFELTPEEERLLEEFFDRAVFDLDEEGT